MTRSSTMRAMVSNISKKPPRTQQVTRHPKLPRTLHTELLRVQLERRRRAQITSRTPQAMPRPSPTRRPRVCRMPQQRPPRAQRRPPGALLRRCTKLPDLFRRSCKCIGQGEGNSTWQPQLILHAQPSTEDRA